MSANLGISVNAQEEEDIWEHGNFKVKFLHFNDCAPAFTL
jgi:hypothetical protein